MRLIDADELRQEWLENGENEYIYDTNSFLDSIDDQPTINPETLPIARELREQLKKVTAVRDGKWIWNPNGMDFGLGAWECSECAVRNNNLPVNDKINPFLFSGSNYCPNCGARMNEEE